jgi:hypothetical protein
VTVTHRRSPAISCRCSRHTAVAGRAAGRGGEILVLDGEPVHRRPARGRSASGADRPHRRRSTAAREKLTRNCSPGGATPPTPHPGLRSRGALQTGRDRADDRLVSATAPTTPRSARLKVIPEYAARWRAGQAHSPRGFGKAEGANAPARPASARVGSSRHDPAAQSGLSVSRRRRCLAAPHRRRPLAHPPRELPAVTPCSW